MRKFHLYKGMGGVPYLCHFCGVVDKYFVVYKWYGKHKQRWFYQVEHIDILQTEIRRVRENEEKKKRRRHHGEGKEEGRGA